MSETSGASRDFRLYAKVIGVLVCALGLAALLVLPSWSNTAETPRRFLGLDEPAEALRRAR
jgi:hypothetical protein